MKKKEDKTMLMAALFAGAAIAGTLAYLYLTETGAAARKSIKRRIKEKGKDVATMAVSRKTGIKKKTVKKVADQVIK